jgi:hypothetical protein
MTSGKKNLGVGAVPPPKPDPLTPAPAPDPRQRTSTAAVLAMLARRRGYRLLFLAVMAAATLVYTLVLPGLHTMRIAPANWGQLTWPDAVLSLALAAGLAIVVTLQVFALRQATASRAATGGGAALGAVGSLVALLPGVCCTPVLPAVLAVAGVGAAGSAATMRAIEPHATLVWIGVLLLLAVTAWWSARRIAANECCPPR